MCCTASVTGPDTGEGELKLYGPAVQTHPDLRAAAADAWWQSQPPEKAAVFTLLIAQAAFVGWDIKRGQMTIHRWSPRKRLHRGQPPLSVEDRPQRPA